MAEEPTKKDLLETLKDALERSNQLAADNAAALQEAKTTIEAQGKVIDDLIAARETAATAASAPPKVVPQPGLQAIPYAGHVKVKEPCFIADTLRQPGDVFYHEVPALWEDDPFEPVVLKGTTDDGKHVTEPHPEAPKPLPFKLRPRSADELARRAAEPQTASKW
jgi:hypothetical protein